MVAAREKLRDYLVRHVGMVLDSDTLREVAGISEWARRIRELRDDEGFDIQTHNDRSDLKPGQYILNSLKLRPVIARDISKEIRAQILERNGYTCQMCGAGAGEIHPFDGRRTRLHIGHVIDKSMGGTDDPSNLRAICSVCNEGAANLTPSASPADKLKAQIRRAPAGHQLEILGWLVGKFPRETAELIQNTAPEQ